MTKTLVRLAGVTVVLLAAIVALAWSRTPVPARKAAAVEPRGLVFEQRWPPALLDLPLAYTPVELDRAHQETPLGLQGAFQGQLAEYPRPPAVVKRRARADTCGRHKLRKVWAQNKRSWKCRK